VYIKMISNKPVPITICQICNLRSVSIIFTKWVDLEYARFLFSTRWVWILARTWAILTEVFLFSSVPPCKCCAHNSIRQLLLSFISHPIIWCYVALILKVSLSNQWGSGWRIEFLWEVCWKKDVMSVLQHD
jgi:hypothetical protein